MCIDDNMEKLASIRAHRQSKNVTFNFKKRAFAYNGIVRRGLTTTLRRVFPVPSHKKSSCDGCQRASSIAYSRYMSRASASKQGPLFQSRKRQRSTDLKMSELIVIDNNNEEGDDNDDVPKIIFECYGGANARTHGSYVDRNITEFVRAGGRTAGAKKPFDQCALTLIAYLQMTLDLELVACQVPLMSERFRLATAIDLLCVDRRTRTRLTVIEIKSTRLRAVSRSECYKQVHGNVEGLPVSVYTEHQLQLWIMVTTIQRELGVVVDDAFVLRTSPKSVTHYPLNPWFARNENVVLDLFHRCSDSAHA